MDPPGGHMVKKRENIFTKGNYSFIKWIICAHRHSCFPHCKNFGGPLTFPVAPSSGQNFKLSHTLACDWIPAELIAFPSASALCLVLTEVVDMVNVPPDKHQHVNIVMVKMYHYSILSVLVLFFHHVTTRRLRRDSLQRAGRRFGDLGESAGCYSKKLKATDSMFNLL